jgi:spermidine synthase
MKLLFLPAPSAAAAVLLFAVPSVLLGMVSPFIARLAMRSLGEAGGTVGRYSAISSAGSIAGTFLGGFVLISFLAIHTILFLVALVLGLVALLLHRGTVKISAPVICLSLIFGLMSEGGAMPMKLEGVTIDTHYNSIRVMERSAYGTNLKIRILQTDPMGAQSLMYVDRPDDLYSDYTKFYDLAFHYRPDIKNVLMLGGGGYCVPKHIGATRPGVAVDVVELDPGITETARKYFGLRDRENHRIFHEDARNFINRESASGAKYDAIFEDVFGSSYNIPFHMTTSECMGKIRSLLTDGGVFVVNIISSLDGELFSGIYSSIASAFPTVMIYPATYPNSVAARQNIMIVALASGDYPVRPSENDYMASLLAHRWTNRFEPKIAAFTDAFAPVEKYSLKL